MGQQAGDREMGFKARVDQWPIVKGAGILIQWLGYDPRIEGPHRMIQRGDLFPVFVVNPLKHVSNARVLAFHHEGNVVLEFGIACRWQIKTVPWNRTLEKAAGVSASTWEFEQPLP